MNQSIGRRKMREEICGGWIEGGGRTRVRVCAYLVRLAVSSPFSLVSRGLSEAVATHQPPQQRERGKKRPTDVKRGGGGGIE